MNSTFNREETINRIIKSVQRLSVHRRPSSIPAHLFDYEWWDTFLTDDMLKSEEVILNYYVTLSEKE